jgi:hypothetical protein
VAVKYSPVLGEALTEVPLYSRSVPVHVQPVGKEPVNVIVEVLGVTKVSGISTIKDELWLR